MKRIIFALVAALIFACQPVALVNAGSDQCVDFPKKGPDPAAFVYHVGDQVEIKKADGQWLPAKIVKIVPWWDTDTCSWKVNYEAEIKNIFRFAETDPAVRIAKPGGKK